MSGLFTRLVARTLGRGPSLAPILPDGWMGQWASAEPMPEPSDTAEKDPNSVLSAKPAPEAMERLSRKKDEVAGDAARDQGTARSPAASERIARPSPPSSHGHRKAKGAADTQKGSNPIRSERAFQDPPGARETGPALPGDADASRTRPAVTLRSAELVATRPPAATTLTQPTISAAQRSERLDPAPRPDGANMLPAPHLALPAIPPTVQIAQPNPAPDIHVSIGRLEVRATPEPPERTGATKEAERPSPIRLADYLAQRQASDR